MVWWTDFDSAEVGNDFSRIAAGDFDSVNCSVRLGHA
jgi:hypothetical protein